MSTSTDSNKVKKRSPVSKGMKGFQSSSGFNGNAQPDEDAATAMWIRDNSYLESLYGRDAISQSCSSNDGDYESTVRADMEHVETLKKENPEYAWGYE